MIANNTKTTNPDILEKLLTLPTAAKQIGIPVSTLRRATNAGLVPVYYPFSMRARVRLSEVNAAIADQSGEV